MPVSKPPPLVLEVNIRIAHSCIFYSYLLLQEQSSITATRSRRSAKPAIQTVSLSLGKAYLLCYAQSLELTMNSKPYPRPSRRYQGWCKGSSGGRFCQLSPQLHGQRQDKGLTPKVKGHTKEKHSRFTKSKSLQTGSEEL